MGETKWLSWRDVSTGPSRVIEVFWMDAAGAQRLSVVEYERDWALHTLVGPELDDVAALTVRGDVRRHDEGQPTRYWDESAFDTDLRNALAKMHAQLGAA